MRGARIAHRFRRTYAAAEIHETYPRSAQKMLPDLTVSGRAAGSAVAN
jgi:hypothetical protein